jgi:hypothetical protein
MERLRDRMTQELQGATPCCGAVCRCVVYTPRFGLRRLGAALASDGAAWSLRGTGVLYFDAAVRPRAKVQDPDASILRFVRTPQRCPTPRHRALRLPRPLPGLPRTTPRPPPSPTAPSQPLHRPPPQSTVPAARGDRGPFTTP